MIVVWRLRAEQELQRQLDYRRQRNPYAADRLRERIDQRVARLAFFPFSGRPSRKAGVRELVIANTPYIAVYRARGDEITILRFFHGSQNR